MRNPVTTLQSSGTVISATVTLGYDLPRTKVREALLEAAETAGLTDAFVQLLELGDFSVEYRVAGILKEVKQILTARSDLRARILDSMHANRTEIAELQKTKERLEEAIAEEKTALEDKWGTEKRS